MRAAISHPDSGSFANDIAARGRRELDIPVRAALTERAARPD